MDNNKMKIVIWGEPMAKQSFRFTKKGHKYQDSDVKDWVGQARVQLLEQLPDDFEPFDCPIIIRDLTFVYPIRANCPKYKKRYIRNGGDLYKDTRPDLLDNLPKNIMDCCEGILFTNDSKIISHRGELKKIYGFKPRIEFEIERYVEDIPR